MSFGVVKMIAFETIEWCQAVSLYMALKGDSRKHGLNI
jgi:hypothetical protein